MGYDDTRYERELEEMYREQEREAAREEEEKKKKQIIFQKRCSKWQKKKTLKNPLKILMDLLLRQVQHLVKIVQEIQMVPGGRRDLMQVNLENEILKETRKFTSYLFLFFIACDFKGDKSPFFLS